MSLDRPSMFQCLESLDLGDGAWAVAGSGPMLAHRLVTSIGDIDIVADEPTWQEALMQSGSDASEGMRGDRIVKLALEGVQIEVFDGWFGSPAVGVIERADVVAGFRFMSLKDVATFKRALDRPKDRSHVELLEIHLSLDDGPPAD